MYNFASSLAPVNFGGQGVFQILLPLFVAFIYFYPLVINVAVLFKRVFAALVTSRDARTFFSASFTVPHHGSGSG